MRSFVIAVATIISAGLAIASVPAERPARRVDALPISNAWTKTIDGAAPAAAAASATHLIAGWPDHLDAFSLETGDRDWSLPIPATRIACDTTFCLVANDDAVRGVDLARRAVSWQQTLSAPLGALPVLRSGWVMLASNTGALRALQMADGREVWAIDSNDPLTGPPSINGDRVAIATRAGKVTLLDLATGRPLWTTTLSSEPGTPKLGGGRVLVGADGGRLIVLDETDGTLKFETRTGANVTGAPSLDEERFYIVGQDGVLRAFDRGNGAQRWYENLATRAADGPTVDGDLVWVPLRTGAVDVRLNDGKTAVQLAAPAGETTRLAAPPIISGTGPRMSVVTASYDLNDIGRWSLARYASGGRITPSRLTPPVPGHAVTLTPPR